tara:strand:+ start:279 stop:1271 length:993 start_codon:yes stop_codon:yes gene_type:complete
MIIKNYEFGKTNFLNSNLFLLYGDNDGFKKETINKVENELKFKKFLYHESEIINNTENFYNTILTKSFFENEKIIIIKRSTDKIFNIIKNLLDKDLSNIKIILDSDILEKKSKLRNLFEKDKNLVCVPFYPDDFKSLNYIATHFFKKEKIKVSQIALNLIIERSNGSRDHLKTELKKIGIYAYSKKEIDIAEVIKLTNLGKNYNISDLVENCLAKNQNKMSKIMNENNFSNEEAIIVIRTFLFKAKRLLNLSKVAKNEKNIEQVIASYKPPIFWKEKEIVKQQLRIWSANKLKRLINEINETELLIKKNINNSMNILFDFIFKISKNVNN